MLGIKNQPWVTLSIAEASPKNVSVEKKKLGWQQNSFQKNTSKSLLRLDFLQPSNNSPIEIPFCYQRSLRPPHIPVEDRQDGTRKKFTRRTPTGTVTCSNSRSFAICVLQIMQPTLSCEDAAICRSPIAKLFSFDVDRLRRFNKGSVNLPRRKKKMCSR